MNVLAFLLMLVLSPPAHAVTLELFQLDLGHWETTRFTSTFPFTQGGGPVFTYTSPSPFDTGHILNPTEPIAVIRAQIGGTLTHQFNAVDSFLYPTDPSVTTLLGNGSLRWFYTLDGVVQDITRTGHGHPRRPPPQRGGGLPKPHN